MADEEIKIRLDVDTVEGVQSLDELNKITKDTGESLGTLEKKAELLKQELSGVKIGTSEFKKLRGELTKTEAQIKDIDLAYEALDFEQKLTKATDVATGLAGGFAATQGAIALAGAESEDFEKTMLKVQGAMALAMGVRDIGTAVVALKQLNVVTKIQTALQKVFNFVMSMNPIGLIVIAIAAFVAGIVLMSDKIADAIKWFKGLNTWAKVVLAIIGGPLIAAIWAVTEGLKALGITESDNDKARREHARRQAILSKARVKELKKEQETARETIKSIKAQQTAIEKRYNREIELSKAAGEDVTRLEEEKLQAVIASTRLQIEQLEIIAAKQREISAERVKQIKLEGGLFEDALVNVEKAFVISTDKQVATQKDALDQAELDLQLHGINERRIKMENAQKASDEAAQRRADERQRIADETTALLDMFGDDELEMDTTLEDNEKDLEIKAQHIAKVKALEDEWRDYKKKKGEKEKQDELDRQQQVHDAKVGMAKQALGALAANLEEGSKAAKAVAAAQIIFDTIKGAQSAYATAQISPYTAVNPAYPAIMASIAAAFGAASLRKLLAASPSGGGSVGTVSSASSGATGGVPIAPTAGSTLIDSSGDNQDNRVYVVESDITNTQNSVGAIVSQATI